MIREPSDVAVDHQEHHVDQEGEGLARDGDPIPGPRHKSCSVVHGNHQDGKYGGAKSIKVAGVQNGHVPKHQKHDISDHARVHRCGQQHFDQLHGIEVEAFAAADVEPGICQHLVLRDILVEDAGGDDGRGQHEVVRGAHHVLKQTLACVSREKGVVEHQKHQHRVLPKAVDHKFACATIVPAPVHQHQSHQIPELRDGEVRRVHCLPPLAPGDAHADLGLLKHRHIVGAVAYGQGHRCRHHPSPDNPHNLRFLRRRHSTSNNHGADRGNLKEDLLVDSLRRAIPGVEWHPQDFLQRAARDDQRHREALLSRLCCLPLRGGHPGLERCVDVQNEDGHLRA
mmetsp:Transcript_117149/g.278263  ORF Transcript_117149/g.278263 Transcript_117149/m.278263 type:complete len:340 (+) Transcript_117149:1495-2514(+)